MRYKIVKQCDVIEDGEITYEYVAVERPWWRPWWTVVKYKSGDCFNELRFDTLEKTKSILYDYIIERNMNENFVTKVSVEVVEFYDVWLDPLD